MSHPINTIYAEAVHEAEQEAYCDFCRNAPCLCDDDYQTDKDNEMQDNNG